MSVLIQYPSVTGKYVNLEKFKRKKPDVTFNIFVSYEHYDDVRIMVNELLEEYGEDFNVHFEIRFDTMVIPNGVNEFVPRRRIYI